MKASALIAEDESLLALDLQGALQRVWPQLTLLANVRHGHAAVEQSLALRPDIVFLDIRMPGLSGLEAAQALAEDWPDGAALPLIVFVTAYDQFALRAFELAAVDYVLKPADDTRLAQTCARLQSALRSRTAAPELLESALAQLRRAIAAHGAGPVVADPPARTRLEVIQAGVGAAVHLVPVGEVIYFEAADKYVRVVTAEREYLIRTALRELLPQLDPQRFWQVHRGTVVRADAIATALRDDSGKVHLSLRGHPDRLVASRLYAHLFKPM